MAEEPKQSSFRVIIVGGGPVALTAAHIFDRIGVDYVILERWHALDVESGASLALWPHNVRLLDQLGLLKEAEASYQPVHLKRNLRRDGSQIAKNDMFDAIERNHGHTWMCFHRAKLMRLLLNNLKGQSKVLLSKEVVSIEHAEKDVTVTCADKSTYTGSMVLGADGVYSTVRRLMNEAAGKPDEPFLATYRGLYGNSVRSPELDAGTLYETHTGGLTIQLIVAEEQQHFLVYELLPTATREHTRFSKQDEEDLAARVADVRYPGAKPGEWITFGEIWKTKHWSAMGNLGEGVATRWHHRRVVLAGDAANKMTPNIGLGLNSGLQAVIQLANRLRPLLRESPNPDERALEVLFAEYQRARIANAKETVSISGLYTRVVAWNNPFWKFADLYIMPLINGDVTLLGLLMSPLIQKAIPLDFLEETSFKPPAYPYKVANAPIAAA